MASVFLTAESEIPNCRAIVEGLAPALNAARIAFPFALVNTIVVSPTRVGREYDATFVVRRGLPAMLAKLVVNSSDDRSRRFSSSVTAASSVPNSLSVKYLSALDSRLAASEREPTVAPLADSRSRMATWQAAARKDRAKNSWAGGTAWRL